MKIGQIFEYAETPHQIIEITARTVITKRLDKKEDTATWDKEGLQFIMDNARAFELKQLVN